ncbi:MAG: PD-(D/E)XK nuclease domain-containing protein, partial [Succinivibrio dextrinosolvens]|nr:PD-(D/E)XK nuclease domain-containing protein [Succinivibrio dextrinosolvens]
IGSANREVSSALNALLSQKIFTPNEVDSFYDADTILENGTVDEIIKHLNSVLATIPYDKYPVEKESTLRALLLMYFSGLRCDVRAEQYNFKGSSDLLINLKKRRVVIELKFSKDGNDSDSLLKEAVEQIKKREYGIENIRDRELLQIAAVFNGSNNVRKITVFEQIS